MKMRIGTHKPCFTLLVFLFLLPQTGLYAQTEAESVVLIEHQSRKAVKQIRKGRMVTAIRKMDNSMVRGKLEEFKGDTLILKRKSGMEKVALDDLEAVSARSFGWRGGRAFLDGAMITFLTMMTAGPILMFLGLILAETVIESFMIVGLLLLGYGFLFALLLVIPFVLIHRRFYLRNGWRARIGKRRR